MSRKTYQTKHETTNKLKNHGFTLIEVIIVIIISAVLAAMLIPYMMTTTNSAKPITMLSDSFKNKSVMENIIADYESSDKDKEALIALKLAIGPEQKLGEPTYQTNGYGNYIVLTNHFIKFVPNGSQYNEQPAPSENPEDPETEEILKVTIKNSRERITRLFYNMVPKEE